MVRVQTSRSLFEDLTPGDEFRAREIAFSRISGSRVGQSKLTTPPLIGESKTFIRRVSFLISTVRDQRRFAQRQATKSFAATVLAEQERRQQQEERQQSFPFRAKPELHNVPFEELVPRGQRSAKEMGIRGFGEPAGFAPSTSITGETFFTPVPSPTTPRGGFTPIPTATDARPQVQQLGFVPSAQGIRDFFGGQTREERIRESARGQLTKQFQSLTPEQLRGAAGVEGTGIAGVSTPEGDSFTFIPTKEQREIARGIAKEKVGFKGLGTELAVGGAKGVVGLGEFVIGLPFQFGVRQVDPTKPIEPFRPGQEIVGKIPFVGERVERLRERQIGFLGKGAEITTAFVLPTALAVRGFKTLRTAGLTRGEAAAELVTGAAPISIRQRVFAPDISRMEFATGKLTQIQVGERPGFQVLTETAKGFPEVQRITLGVSGEEAGAGFAFIQRPRLEIKPTFRGLETRVGIETEFLPTAARPISEEFPAFGFAAEGRGVEFQTRIQEAGARRIATEFRGLEEGRPFTELTLRPDIPVVSTKVFAGELPIRRIGGRIGERKRLDVEEFAFGVGEDLFITPRKAPFPRRILEKARFLEPTEELGIEGFFAQARGKGIRLKVSPVEPQAGITSFRGVRPKRPRTQQQAIKQQFEDTGKLLAQSHVALKVTGLTVPKQPPQVGFPTIVGGAGARGAFAGQGLYERTAGEFAFIARPSMRSERLIFQPAFKELQLKMQPLAISQFGLSSQRELQKTTQLVFPVSAFGQMQLPIQREAQITVPVQELGTGTRLVFEELTFPFTPFAPAFPRPPRRFGFLPPVFFPALGFGEKKPRRVKPKRKFKRVPSLAALELDITAEKPVAGEITGLVSRPILVPRKKKKKKK